MQPHIAVRHSHSPFAGHAAEPELMTMGVPRIDFSGVDPSAPGAGPAWAAVRAQVMDALTSHGFFDAHYPRLTPELRAGLFDGAARPLFSLPTDAKRRNSYGPGKPFHGYLGGLPGLDAYESLAIVDGHKAGPVRAFADLMWPDGGNNAAAAFCETVHGAAEQMAELEGTVRRMVLEGLGVAHHHDDDRAAWHLFRMSEYGVPSAASAREVRYGSHQDTNSLSVVCQHGDVDGLEMQTGDGQWVLLHPSPTSLLVMAGNALRAWTNDRVRAPFHRITVGGDVTRYSAILFAVPGGSVRAPEELVDDEDHPRRFRSYDDDEFVRFCVSEEGARHQDKLKAYCGV